MKETNKWTVKKLVEFKGHVGELCIQCDIYRNNVKVAEYSDDSWGGMARIYWEDAENKPEVEIIRKKYNGEVIKYGVRPRKR